MAKAPPFTAKGAKGAPPMAPMGKGKGAPPMAPKGKGSAKGAKPMPPWLTGKK